MVLSPPNWILLLTFYLAIAYILILIAKWLISVAVTCFTHYPTVCNKLYRKTWEPETVYLHQFYESPVAPNLSPFCLKVEAWLRANNIKYEVCPTSIRRSKEGLLPFIELNGKQIADSQLILFYLQDHFKITDDLTESEKGIARAVDRMVEGSSFYALIYSKAYENTQNFVDPKVSGIRFPWSIITPLLSCFAKRMFRERLYAHGIGRHKREEIIAILRNDIQAIDRILGDNEFLFGENLTTPDFTIFGHLATTYYLPFPQPIKSLLDDEFPRVRVYLECLRKRLFPEWKTADAKLEQTS